MAFDGRDFCFVSPSNQIACDLNGHEDPPVTLYVEGEHFTELAYLSVADMKALRDWLNDQLASVEA